VSTAAIILAGGRASRLGGADKASVEVDGRALLDHALDAVEGCSPLIVVGPSALARDGVTVVREDPPFGGPVAALSAGLNALPEPAPAETWVLACDLPRAHRIVALLRPEALGDADGVILADAGGREQWLAGRYNTQSLRAAVGALPEVAGASVRRMLAACRLRVVPDRVGASIDLDTWPAIEHYRRMNESPADLDAWVTELAGALGLDPSRVPTGQLLDLTRDAAHGVTRPAGPLTTYLVGLAVAGGMTMDDAAAATRAAIQRHAAAADES